MEIDWSGVTIKNAKTEVDWNALSVIGEEVGEDFYTYGVPIFMQAKDAAW